MSARALVAAALLLALLGCDSPEPLDVEPSGFLGDYSQLKPDRREPARIVYIDPEADFSGYRRVVLEPVTAWAPGGSQLASLPQSERERLVQHFETALRRQLALEFDLVDEAGPGTLRIRVAITRAQESDDPNELESSIEVEVLDAVSGQRVVAAADTRAGGTPRKGANRAWSGVYESLDYWADVIRARLAAFRAADAALAADR
ncbi:MAG: DUF3313 domain-containing protein [Myxococcota bacterium]|nr:DUF3313 domain-containing protein [Myxococcota bacterium]